jgi:hypothetical protein
MKICSRCGLEKHESEFHKRKETKDGLKFHCKVCCKAYKAEYYKVNKDKEIAYKAEYYKANKDKEDKRKANQAEWHKKNKDKRRVKSAEYYKANKDKIKAKNDEYYITNKDKITEYYRKRRQTDPLFRLQGNLRHRIWNALKRKLKSATTFQLVGCTIDFLKQHLESQFKPGMSWENQGQWHIDHIRPCASFNLLDPIQQQQCFHYSNLQPLWAEENLSKSDTYEVNNGVLG